MDTSANKNSICVNFTYEEEQLLIRLVEKYQNIVECKRSNSVTWKEKETAWHSIENEFNSSSGKCFRSVKNLKEKYNNIKKKTKQKWTQEKNMVLKFGGGCYNLPNQSNVDSIMKDILGEQLTGLENNYDDRSFAAEYPTDPVNVIEEVVVNSMCNDHSYLNDNFVLKELDNNCQSANSKNSVVVTNNNSNSSADLEPSTQEHDWSTYTKKNLKKPVSHKLRSEPNVKKIRTHSITKKIMNPSNILIEEKLEFVRLQKEKFLEEHNLRMDLLKKKIELIDRKLATEQQN